ncbi:MAG: hypothetical protein KDC38_19185 [Planctomycetes bacterium]|nr:hypothetical protein [Planctomycetota bacterium]
MAGASLGLPGVLFWTWSIVPVFARTDEFTGALAILPLFAISVLCVLLALLLHPRWSVITVVWGLNWHVFLLLVGPLIRIFGRLWG